MDGLGKIHLLGCQVTFRILAHLIGQDEKAVERRAELVRHIGQELRLVLGGEGQLLGFFL